MISLIDQKQQQLYIHIDGIGGNHPRDIQMSRGGILSSGSYNAGPNHPSNYSVLLKTSLTKNGSSSVTAPHTAPPPHPTPPRMVRTHRHHCCFYSAPVRVR